MKNYLTIFTHSLTSFFIFLLLIFSFHGFFFRVRLLTFVHVMPAGTSITDVSIGLYLNRISAVDENNEVSTFIYYPVNKFSFLSIFPLAPFFMCNVAVFRFSWVKMLIFMKLLDCINTRFGWVWLNPSKQTEYLNVAHSLVFSIEIDWNEEISYLLCHLLISSLFVNFPFGGAGNIIRCIFASQLGG